MSQIIRKGVKSLSKSGSAKLTDDVTLSEGSNITLTQTGNDIEIAASGGGGSGDVTGPASSTDNAIAVFDGTTGKLLQDSEATLDPDTLNLSLVPSVPAPDTGVLSVVVVQTDTINERNTASGVTIDGVLIKDDSISAVAGSFMAISTDNILEATPTVGVTIDGVLLKDGEVDGRDVAADGSKLDGIEAGADVTDSTNVQAALPSGTNGQVLKHNGTSWAAGTDNNTTYSEISEANIENTGSSTVGLITGRRAEALLDNEASKARTLTNKTLNLSSNTLSNPYKFRVWRQSSYNLTNTAAAIPWDTEYFDTNSDFSSGAYTVPVAGFYRFSARISCANSSILLIELRVNGTLVARGGDTRTISTSAGVTLSDLIQLSAGDTVAIYAICDSTRALVVTEGHNYFSGILESQT